MTNVQEYVDVEYPPTMTFNIETLEPTKVLRERVELMDRFAPNFFCGERFLDVGCSKGWFSLAHAGQFDEVVGVDCNQKNITLCNLLKKCNSEFVCSSFRDFVDCRTFDRIFIGNVAHHLFLECGGWEWLAKLASLASDMVLVEGPMDMGCKDMKCLIPCVLWREFNRFLAEMNRYFWFEKSVSSVSYTPDRYLMLFHKKPAVRVDFDRLPLFKLLKQDEEFVVFVSHYWNKPCVVKVCKKPSELTGFLGRIANLSPVTNGCVAEVWKGGKYVGWLEDYNPVPHYRLFENERVLWQRHCLHQLFLVKNGLVDMDVSTINFFKLTDELFDKSVVFPVGQVPKIHVDNYFINLNNSFRTVSQKSQDAIREAMLTGDSKRVEEVYGKLLN